MPEAELDVVLAPDVDDAGDRHESNAVGEVHSESDPEAQRVALLHDDGIACQSLVRTDATLQRG